MYIICVYLKFHAIKYILTGILLFKASPPVACTTTWDTPNHKTITANPKEYSLFSPILQLLDQKFALDEDSLQIGTYVVIW